MKNERNYGPRPVLYCPAPVQVAEMFPNALRAIAEHCIYGSKKYNPDEEVHWAFHKSTGHVEKAIGHLERAGEIDEETGRSHTINAAWRAVAALETELIGQGARPGWRVRMTPQTFDLSDYPLNVELGGAGE